jgi:hypothetical protein
MKHKKTIIHIVKLHFKTDANDVSNTWFFRKEKHQYFAMINTNGVVTAFLELFNIFGAFYF